MRTSKTLLLAALLGAVPGVAIAQAPPTAATPQQPSSTAPAPAREIPASSNCAPTQPKSGEGPAAPGGVTTGQAPSEPLGDKLAKSDGVLCPPPNVDPQMRAPAPSGGNTPVIPPPGSPGGDQSIRPK